ncbi:MAG: putative Major facilitator superfamily 1 protein [Frankiales bacterium]|nr:putative Major facilitator superfamily 1 protein [Frankiales bacterium]
MPRDDVREPDDAGVSSGGAGLLVRVPWRSRWTALLAVLAVATVLRPSVVVVGPVLSRLQSALGLGSASASLLTALPVVCFGAGAFAGPGLVRRLGVDVAVSGALVVLVAGAAVRVLGGPVLLFVGTSAVGVGIAVCNVLLPALVRREFADRIGLVTGLYTSTLALAAAVAALSAVPLSDRFSASWRPPLVLWCLLAVVALVAWAPHLWTHPRHTVVAGEAPRAALALLRQRPVQALTAFMGLQSIGFYAMATWLPTLLQDEGLTPGASGALLSLATLLGIPAALAVPVLGARMRHQRGIALGATALTAAGWAGLLLAPAALPVLWAVLLGLGTGSTFPTALLLIALRSSDAAAAPRLSAAVQGVGYLIAASGPFLVGLLHDSTGGWTHPLLFLLALNVVQGAAGWVAGREAGTSRS